MSSFAHFRAMGAVQTLITILLVISLSGCSDLYRYLKSGDVGWALKKELRDKKAGQIELTELTDFEWDELYLFGPYQPTHEVCRRLKLSPADCETTITSESTDDGEMLMVFRLAGKVVHTEMHSRFHGDFTPVPEEPFITSSAVFSVSVRGKSSSGENWLILRPVSQATTIH